MAASDPAKVLSKKTKVVAAVDLPGVPAGTPGQVIIVNGLSWIRYWVRFANGVVTGSVNRSALATPAEWERKLAGGDDVEATGGSGAADADGDAGGGDDAGVMVNGVLVPTKLIERAKAARARLAA